jgi:signal transduction histidine kinase
MIPRRTIIVSQLRLFILLVILLIGVMLFLNLAYLTENQLRNIAMQLELHRDRIYNAMVTAAQREKEKDPALVIATDSTVRASLQAAVDKIEVLGYAAVLDESGTPLVAVNLGRANQIGGNEQDMQRLLENYSLAQMASLLWGQTIYQYSFPAAIGRHRDGRAFIAQIRFSAPAANLRGALANIFFINFFIAIIALIMSVMITFRAANRLLQPLDLLISQLEKIERGELNISGNSQKLDLISIGLVNKLQVLSKRLAGERTELETTRGRLTQIIGNIEERLLMLNPDKRVMLMSPKADHLLGVAGIDLAGAKLDDMLGSNHPLVELVNRVQESRGSVEHLMIIDQNGQGKRQVLTSVQYIEDKGDPVGMLVSLRDFDSFKQFQSQLDYSDKLAALGRITSGVAHEVKNPLNAMVIHLEILRAKLAQPGADFTPQLDILTSEIKRLDRVVQTFLNFTRPVPINLVPIDLNDLVHQITRLAAAEAAAHRVELREDLCPEYLRVNGDADLLKQTLLNIILNGCQAMPQGGPLEIRTRRAGSYALITIADRGVGIPPDVRDKIFKLYYTTKENGNGIGLAQAFRALQLHNGRIEFESTVDVGTTFKISLPEV